MKIAKIYLLNALFHMDREYDYKLPDMLGDVNKGFLVLVPFGRGNRRVFGIVSSVMEVGEETAELKYSELKYADDAIGGIYYVSEEMFALAEYVKKITLCTFGEAVRLVMPPIVSSLAFKTESEKYKIDIRENIRYSKTVCIKDTNAVLRGSVQKRAVKYLSSIGECDVSVLKQDTGISFSKIKPLIDRGIIYLKETEKIRNPYKKYSESRDRSKIILNSSQTDAYEKAEKLINSGKPAAVLLFGVTGSGKTKVVLKTIDKVI